MDADSMDVAYVANLARIHLTDAELAKFSAQLGDIVAYVRKIRELDLRGIEPTSHAVAAQNVFREDEQRPGLDPAAALGNAPAAVNGQFRVPQIVE
jgi:aspartyl-tRNA(Asn)/glutamyl-tRNA(Gln) amidotransferase subunit C